MLSDLHGGDFDGDLLFNKIVAGKPDVVIMAGDMANAKFEFSDGSIIRLLRKLKGKIPVYYGIGNHEARLKWSPEKFGVSYKKYLSSVSKNGAVVLDNESLFLDEYGVSLTGLTLTEDYYRKFTKKKTDEEAIKDFVGEKPNFEILIAHNPEYFEEYSKRGSELILSGHLHGGIMRLPNKLGAISPRFSLFPAYSGGMYKRRKSRMIVSRGLGQHTIPVRVFNTCELVFIDLLK